MGPRLPGRRRRVRSTVSGTWPASRRVLSWVTGNPQAAEDVMQETFAQLWKRPNGFQPERGTLRAYLFGAARKRASEWWRKNGRENGATIPPFPFSPDDTIDVKPNVFRLTAPVLLRRNEVVFNFGGASGQFDDEPGNGGAVYWPGEGRFLFSPRSFPGAVEGNVAGSQVEFKAEGQTYTLLTGVPPTSAEHVWMKHEPDYKPSQRDPHPKDDIGSLGGAKKSAFASE
jgi:hypothetical protein